METKIYILTGNIKTGKTTALLNWCKNRTDVSGIATPVINGKRFFVNIATADTFKMEADETEVDTLNIGRFRFSKEAFHTANTILQQLSNCKYVVIDEIGPLELQQQGLYASVQFLLAGKKNSLILIVREKLVDAVIDFFQLLQPTILNTNSLQQLI